MNNQKAVNETVVPTGTQRVNSNLSQTKTLSNTTNGGELTIIYLRQTKTLCSITNGSELTVIYLRQTKL